MSASKKGIEKVVEPFTKQVDGMKFLSKDKVDDAVDSILSSYNNICTNIEETVGRDKLVVSNATSRARKPIYEIYIE